MRSKTALQQANFKFSEVKQLFYFKHGIAHPLAYGRYNPTTKMGMLRIPKNACSATCSTIADDNGFNHTNLLTVRHSVETCIIILRDPLLRFKSAVNMYLGDRSFSNGITIEEIGTRKYTIKEWWNKDKFSSNEHFYLQSRFVWLAKQALPNAKFDFFYMGSDNNIALDLQNKYNFVNIPSHTINKSMNIATTFNEEIIKSIYKEDYKLIKSTTCENI